MRPTPCISPCAKCSRRRSAQMRMRLDALTRIAERVEVDPEVRGREPVFRRTRIPVYAVARKLELGSTEAELYEDHPRLEKGDLEIARRYGCIPAAAAERRAKPPRRPRSTGDRTSCAMRTRSAGYHPLGEEIWRQTGGAVDAFLHAVSTAHSIHGTAEALRGRRPALHVSGGPRTAVRRFRGIYEAGGREAQHPHCAPGRRPRGRRHPGVDRGLLQGDRRRRACPEARHASCTWPSGMG